MADENQGGTLCPVCGQGRLAVNSEKTIIHCTEQKTEKSGKDFIEVGNCQFKLFLNQTKIFGKQLTIQDVKKLVNGDGVKNAKGDTMYFDKTAEPYYTRIEWAEKKPDILI